MQIIMYGTAGAAGARRLWETEEAVRAALPSFIGDNLLHADDLHPTGMPQDMPADMLTDIPETEHAIAIGDGGVYAALWRLGERYGLGLCVYGESIPILQETIEVCEIADKNPYRLESDGFLCACNEMPREGGRCIGYLTQTKERIVIGREGVRYLTKPERNY